MKFSKHKSHDQRRRERAIQRLRENLTIIELKYCSKIVSRQIRINFYTGNSIFVRDSTEMSTVFYLNFALIKVVKLRVISKINNIQVDLYAR